jgi:hypothetical protein
MQQSASCGYCGVIDATVSQRGIPVANAGVSELWLLWACGWLARLSSPYHLRYVPAYGMVPLPTWLHSGPMMWPATVQTTPSPDDP